MKPFHNPEDTIVAISTPMGAGGIGIVRLSGRHALAIADRMFATKKGEKPSSFKSFSVHYGDVCRRKGDAVIDEALVTVMRAPKSYTREDVVEISCHGGIVSLRAVLALAADLGARLAEPGEFTQRAFLNGRIDLAQAEAVLDVIQAKTEAFLRVSAHQLKGDLSTELDAIREQLMNVYVQIEAIVNFPEDDVNGDSSSSTLMWDQVHAAQERVEALLRSGEHGRILKEGIKIAICGRTNVGKSSLLNALLKAPRAIVSEIAGTTRDTIEETAQIRGIPFQLVDTAGILEPRDLIEQEAIKRSHDVIEGADLALIVFDAGAGLTPDDERLMSVVEGQNVLAVLNKTDLPPKIDEQRIRDRYEESRILKISALTRQGIEALETAIVENVWHEQRIDTQGILVSNLRHIHALKNCRDALTRSRELLKRQMSPEFISEEIKAAVNFLDRITGRDIDADLLENIFSKFCIGK
ncbi:MAG TPA: tRNA uridine-5-carboxymethylaminomethyl(34) synthesis GTPase MnmE [Candidatus Omnitrophota bacterium]|nr:tRNA uridine-5-carboxymethylaminomethyl(34) synthesis GTPase MnmE [Candidatus Omnitrophota bacterium]